MVECCVPRDVQEMELAPRADRDPQRMRERGDARLREVGRTKNGLEDGCGHGDSSTASRGIKIAAQLSGIPEDAGTSSRVS